MKFTTLITLITLITSSMAFAKDIAQYNFSVRGNVDGQYHSVEVTLTDLQELKIKDTITTGRFPFFIPENGEAQEIEITKDLNDISYNILRQKVINLSKAEIVKKKNQIVCMVMPSPEMSNNHLSVARHYDHNSNDFIGNMELVAGPTGCWVSNPVYPKHDYNQRSANALKESMKLLALDAIGDEL